MLKERVVPSGNTFRDFLHTSQCQQVRALGSEETPLPNLNGALTHINYLFNITLKNELYLVRTLHPSCPRALATEVDGGLPHTPFHLILCSTTSCAREGFRSYTTISVGVVAEVPQHQTERGHSHFYYFFFNIMLQNEWCAGSIEVLLALNPTINVGVATDEPLLAD